MRRRYVHRPPPHTNTYAEVDDERSSTPVSAATPWRIRFGMRGLLMLMVIASMVFAGMGYLLHAIRGGDRGFHLAFVLFTLIAPIGLLAVFSIANWIRERVERRE